MLSSAVLPFLLLPFVHAAVLIHIQDEHHDHKNNRALPSTWFHSEDHPAHALFKRAPTTDGLTYAPVGSPSWSAGYPTSTPDPNQYPKAWKDALATAVASGKIPNTPVSSTAGGGNPVYPTGTDPMSQAVCSATYKCRNLGYDIWDAPPSTIGISFDDGPLPVSSTLYQFLRSNKQKATHFMIGVNIINNPNQFNEAYQTNGDDIAVHTWTHPYMTTLTNDQLLGQFGWSMELIHNSTGGRLPRFWRPPYGDTDNRVRAIAKEIFGLDTILWNQDTEDWSIGQPTGTTLQAVDDSMKQWITGPKTPGLIVLEHELSNNSIQGFINAFPLMKSNGWSTIAVTQLNATSPWQNTANPTGVVTPSNILVGASAIAASSSSASSSSTKLTPSSTSTSVVPASASEASKQTNDSSSFRGTASYLAYSFVSIFIALAFL